MRETIFVIGVIALMGCRGPARMIKETKTSSPEAALEKTLHEIHNDLRNCRSDFPQLEGIDRATIRITPAEGSFDFGYAQGFVKDDRMRGPTFEKNGCSMMVQMAYPADPEAAQSRPIDGQAIPASDGQFVVVWTLVRAERTEAGRIFVEKVEKVIHSRLAELRKELTGRE